MSIYQNLFNHCPESSGLEAVVSESNFDAEVPGSPRGGRYGATGRTRLRSRISAMSLHSAGALGERGGGLASSRCLARSSAEAPSRPILRGRRPPGAARGSESGFSPPHGSCCFSFVHDISYFSSVHESPCFSSVIGLERMSSPQGLAPGSGPASASARAPLPAPAEGWPDADTGPVPPAAAAAFTALYPDKPDMDNSSSWKPSRIPPPRPPSSLPRVLAESWARPAWPTPGTRGRC